jgi:hypothetical protein
MLLQNGQKLRLEIALSMMLLLTGDARYYGIIRFSPRKA